MAVAKVTAIAFYISLRVILVADSSAHCIGVLGHSVKRVVFTADRARVVGGGEHVSVCVVSIK